VLFDRLSSKNLTGFAVWVPQLGAKVDNVADATTLLPDARVRQYWDGGDALGSAYGRVLPTPETAAWDVYLLYDRGITWTEKDPPKPTFWMHQLSVTTAPRLDIDVFADHARQLLGHTR
jgi:hypothetical protein